MKINFEVDPTYDKKFVVVMLKGSDWQYRAKKMGLPIELVEKINKSSGEQLQEAENELENIIKDVYSELGTFIYKARDGYQESWNKIIEEFSATVEKVSVPWFYDDYIVKITHFNAGLSNWNGNMVGRWWRENYDMQRRITAHEILLAHFFSIHRNLYKDRDLEDKQIWALAEIFGFAMTSLVPEISKFWPWDKKGYYTDHNYPQIVELQNELKNPFINRKSFDDYVREGIELVKKYPDIY